MVLGSLRCGACGVLVKENDEVILGEFHTVAHVECANQLKEANKDTGLFKEIIDRYEFFQSASCR